MSIWDEMSEVKQMDADRILAQLFSDKKKKYHTQIHNPVAISTLEIVANYFDDLGVKSLIKEYIDNYRTNMIALDRQRAKEIVEAYKSKAEAEAKTKTLRDVMLPK